MNTVAMNLLVGTHPLQQSPSGGLAFFLGGRQIWVYLAGDREPLDPSSVTQTPGPASVSLPRS